MFNPMIFGMSNNFIKGFNYTVQDKDTLEIISKRYKVPVNNIIIANKLAYPYAIKSGEKVFIPGREEPVAPDGGSIYTVKYGDNLQRIAKKFNVLTEDLIEQNYLNSEYSIYIGQKLLIPSKDIDENNLEQNGIDSDKKDDKNEIKIYPIGQNGMDKTSGASNINKQLSNKFSVAKRGDKGKDIAMLKRLVSTLGYKIRKVDGYFDANLEQEIRKIQRDAGFEETGYADQEVWEYIFSSVNSMPGMYN